MIFKGIKIRVSCSNWEQVKILDNFWDSFSSLININKLVGLGFGWKDNYFNYAIGLIDNFDELDKIKQCKIDESEYMEIALPDTGWITKKGKALDLQKIYEESFDCYNFKYKYEIERFDDKGNCEISVLLENKL